MKAYTPDLCAKIAQACDEGVASRRQPARQFRVSLAFIQKMLLRRRLTSFPLRPRTLGAGAVCLMRAGWSSWRDSFANTMT